MKRKRPTKKRRDPVLVALLAELIKMEDVIRCGPTFSHSYYISRALELIDDAEKEGK